MNDDATTVRVILVDDHPAVLRQTLQILPERFDVVQTLQDGLDLETAVRDWQPDIVVLDITLPAINGVQLARQLRANGCAARIVFLTVHADPDYAQEAFNVGALGFVIKPRLASDLVAALDAAVAGKRFVSPCPELQEFQSKDKENA
jgi:DNA-binding NarL/FixJ family response regulator